MTLNQFVICCAGVAMLLVASGYYLLGAIILIVAIGLYSLGMYLAWDILEFWSKLSTVWQDIPEVIIAGETTWFSKRGVNIDSIDALYRKLTIYKGLFEVKVDEAVIDAFEQLYPDLRLSKTAEVPPRTKVMFYLDLVFKYKPEYLPDIQRAILVKKKVGGKKKPAKEKPLQSLRPVFD